MDFRTGDFPLLASLIAGYIPTYSPSKGHVSPEAQLMLSALQVNPDATSEEQTQLAALRQGLLQVWMLMPWIFPLKSGRKAITGLWQKWDDS